MYYLGQSSEELVVKDLTTFNQHELTAFSKNGLLILWNIEGEMVLYIDHVEHRIAANRIVFLTEFHKVTVRSVGLVRLIRFNRSFYCIIDHDEEVGCKGILFYGSAHVPVITVSNEEVVKFQTLWEMLSLEMESRDNLQQEMLQMMLKRFVILSTRLFKKQYRLPATGKVQLDTIREFNYLVESHFRTKHTVAAYAALLNKSPKSLTNLFALNGQKKPLQIIQDRLLLEARRQLLYTDKIVKEIAYEMGFEDLQTFSRFFSNKEGVSPREYRERKLRHFIKEGKNANTPGVIA